MWKTSGSGWIDAAIKISSIYSTFAFHFDAILGWKKIKFQKLKCNSRWHQGRDKQKSKIMTQWTLKILMHRGPKIKTR